MKWFGLFMLSVQIIVVRGGSMECMSGGGACLALALTVLHHTHIWHAANGRSPLQ